MLALTRRRFWELEDGIYGWGTYTDLPIGMSYYPSDNAHGHDRSISRGRGVSLASYTWGQPARRLAALSTTQRSDLVIHNVARVHPQILEERMVDQVVSWCDPHQKGRRASVIPASDGRLTVSVPIQIKRRSGRKLVTLPSVETTPRRCDGEPMPLQLALARGHRWLAMLESGQVESMREIARKEGVDSSYVSRMVNLTTLAPDIVSAILERPFLPT